MAIDILGATEISSELEVVKEGEAVRKQFSCNFGIYYLKTKVSG